MIAWSETGNRFDDGSSGYCECVYFAIEHMSIKDFCRLMISTQASQNLYKPVSWALPEDPSMKKLYKKMKWFSAMRFNILMVLILIILAT